MCLEELFPNAMYYLQLKTIKYYTFIIKQEREITRKKCIIDIALNIGVALVDLHFLYEESVYVLNNDQNQKSILYIFASPE